MAIINEENIEEEIDLVEQARILSAKNHAQAVDKMLIITKLEIERDKEEDWIRKASLTAKIINLKNFDYLDT